jgi:hypothetical protein
VKQPAAVCTDSRNTFGALSFHPHGPCLTEWKIVKASSSAIFSTAPLNLACGDKFQNSNWGQLKIVSLLKEF